MQQAEYRNAYQEYISHMSQLEVSAAGRESPAQALAGQFLSASSEEKTKEGEQDGRKPYAKKGSKPADTIADFSSAPDGACLDPITEEDEKSEHGSATKIPPRRKTRGQGPCYHSVPSDEDDSGDEETDATPLLREEPWAAKPDLGLLSTGKSFVSDIMLDKKSSDSGVRSSRSSSDHSLQDEESESSQEKKEEETHLIELVLESPVKKRVLPHRLGDLQDETVARMSICSDALSDSSTPEESWPASAVSNLNCSTDNTALNNNINNSTQQENSGSTDCPSLIIRPGSSTETNQNLHGVQRKRSIGPDAAEERESVLWA